METSNSTGPGLTIRFVQLQPRATPRDPRQEPLRHQGHAVPEQPWPGQDSVLLAVLWVPPTERAVDSGIATRRNENMELIVVLPL